MGEVDVFTKHYNQKITSKLNNHRVPCVFLGYAKDHAANIYCIMKLYTNTIILLKNIEWLKKTYGKNKWKANSSTRNMKTVKTIKKYKVTAEKISDKED